jgi:U4/U6 small nuclear ribonucleoprotein PRP4
MASSSTDATVPMPGGYGDQTADATASATQKELFYSPASEELIASRKFLCEYSFPRTKARLEKTRAIRSDPVQQAAEDQRTAELYLSLKDMHLNGSQFGDNRPLTCVRYSPDAKIVASSSLNPEIKLWNSDTLEHVGSLCAHEERVTSLAWRPQTDSSQPTILATSSADGKCYLWDCRNIVSEGSNNDSSSPMEEDSEKPVINGTDESTSTTPVLKTPLCTLGGHEGTVTRCGFHPSGFYVGTTGEDFTWRLWDVEMNTELLLQDGHIKGCDAIAFHHDGSLLLTGDLGGLALLWDLRSGQCVQAFQGHIKKIVSASFNPNGFQVATGSTDNMARIWDLRSKKCGYALPAHSKSISDVRYSSSGESLTTCSFDGTVKVWNARNFDILRTLSGHSGKVMSCDISHDEKNIISGGFDRTIKSWAKDSF